MPVFVCLRIWQTKEISRHALVCSVYQQIDLNEVNVLSRNVAVPPEFLYLTPR